MGDQYHNNGRNYGHMGPVNNFGPPKRDFLSASASAMRNEMLKWPRDQRIKLGSVQGDLEAHEMAVQMRDFLVENGFTNVEAFHQAMFAEPPKGIIKNIIDGVIEITVGHA